MKAKRCVAVLAVSVTLILAVWAVARAAGKAERQLPQAKYADKQSDTLRGVQSIYVLVEKLNPAIEQLGLTREALRTDTELQLRQYGLKVLDSEEWVKTPDAPDLYINVNVMPLTEDPIPFLAVSIEIRVDQQAWLVRDPTLRCSAATWHTSAAWRVPRARLIAVREVVKDQVSKFINDYLAVNPKQAPAKP